MNIQAIIDKRKSDLAKASPFKNSYDRQLVIPTSELQLMVDTLEQQQREIERLKEIDERECEFIAKLREQLAEKDKEIDYLRIQRESLEVKLQHYRGYQ